MSIRPVKRLIKSKPTTEGAGVHLRRAFGFGNTSDFDPFLLLDDLREPWSMATVWGITEPSPPATFNG